MSNKKILEEYLLTTTKKTPFLLDDNNNGKTIMLSGAWGAGKTHFWQNEIEPSLSEQLKKNEKACVYVSLYGKDNIEAIKTEILFKAYESIKKENELKKKAISAFGMGSRAFSFSALGFKLSTKELGEKLTEYDEEKKIEEAEFFIADGGVICLDDFERKSKQIDLNDLFGFISQLALDMKCKIIIILNSDVFTGKEAEVFRNVKEKTVNKFFYYEPTIEELFESILSDERYDKLNDYKEDILKAIKETEELNARIYMQVLDNCLEWLEVKEELDKNIIRVLVLGTFNFVLNHMVLDYSKIKLGKKSSNPSGNVSLLRTPSSYIPYKFLSKYPLKIKNNIGQYISKSNEEYVNICNKKSLDFLEDLKRNVSTENFISEEINWIKEHKAELKALWKYGYRLYYVADVEEEIYNEIAQFIKTGILI